MPLSDKLRNRFQDLVTKHEVVLFMKGTRGAPACGFSASVVQILDEMLPAYETVNVLSDPEVRDGIKEFSQWPTIPQLYVRGTFMGGSDIVREMHASGELAKALGVSGEVAPPAITITPAAASALREAGVGDGDAKLLVQIGPRFEYDLSVGPSSKGDIEVEAAGFKVALGRGDARRAEGLVIDFVNGPAGAGFKLSSPLEPAKVKALSVKELKVWMDENRVFELVDVRTEREREIAEMPGARMLDQDGEEHLRSLDREVIVVFHCHHGIRSRSAAERFLSEGFKNVYNLTGGIDAWSLEVDPKVARY